MYEKVLRRLNNYILFNYIDFLYYHIHIYLYIVKRRTLLMPLIMLSCNLLQVRQEYLSDPHIIIDQDAAVQLCCLEMRRYFKDLPQNALDKKSNFEYLEREVGMQKFMPQRILETFKAKSLRKSIHQHFKKYTQLDEQSCMFRFLEILKQYYRYGNV